MTNRKFSQQCLGRLVVIELKRGNTCSLALLTGWHIHLVVSMEQLEPAPLGKEPYKRPANERPPAVEADDYLVGRLLDRRVRRVGRDRKEIVPRQVVWLQA
jgi:hypothetical protein